MTQDQELLESLDYVTLKNLCQSSASLRERCQASDIQALLKKKERESAFIILSRPRIYDDNIIVDMIIKYPKSPKLLETYLRDLKFRIGRPSRISGSTINSDIESLVNGVSFSGWWSHLGQYISWYSSSGDFVRLWPKSKAETFFIFSAQLYHKILVSILELYDLEYAIELEGGKTSQEEIYIHV